jgi:predicted nucleic acid-binding protein
LTIIDTDILIDAARGLSHAIEFLESLESRAISVVTQMELIVGCRNKAELQNLNLFLNRFDLLKITSAVSDISVELISQYYLSHGLLIADSLIAATAIAYAQPLVTKNQRDFRFISGLDLLPYLELS